MWGKEVSATLSRKETKKKENYTSVRANEAMAAAGLAGLRGEAWWRGGGFENPACGEKRSLQWSEKKRKKEEKNLCPLMQAIAAAGVGAEGKRQRRPGGLRASRRGRSRPSCVGCGGGPRAVVAGVVAAAPRRRALAVKKPYLGKRWQRSCEAGGTLSHATD